MSIPVSKLECYEEILKKKAYEEYEIWISNFALNLTNIWKEKSASLLIPQHTSSDRYGLVIGKGPSIKKREHLRILAESDFSGSIICCDGKLIDVLKAGITPDKFPNFFVVTVDPLPAIKKHYDHDIVDRYGKMIKGVFSTITHPDAVERARIAGIDVHWVHSLADLHEGKKSFNYITSIMTRSKNHSNGLPAIQTGGNVGTSSWFVGWKILKCNNVALIGINHGWEEDDPWESILFHALNNNDMPIEQIKFDRTTEISKRLFPTIHNPDLKTNCILDPIFQLYRSALLEFIERSPEWVTTYNATEGGSIFGKRVNTITLRDFIQKSRT